MRGLVGTVNQKHAFGLAPATQDAADPPLASPKRRSTAKPTSRRAAASSSSPPRRAAPPAHGGRAAEAPPQARDRDDAPAAVRGKEQPLVGGAPRHEHVA